MNSKKIRMEKLLAAFGIILVNIVSVYAFSGLIYFLLYGSPLIPKWAIPGTVMIILLILTFWNLYLWHLYDEHLK